MAKGIVTVTPSATGHGGKVIVFENLQYALNKVENGSVLDIYFFNPDIPSLNVGDIVNIDIESTSLCRFQRKLDRLPMTKGTVNPLPAPGSQGQLTVSFVSEVNPYHVAVRNVLSFDDPQLSGLKLDDEVECLPTSGSECIVTKVLVLA